MEKIKCDVLIVCALKKEYDQVLKIQENNWTEQKLPDGYIIAVSNFTKNDKYLSIVVTHQVDTGREENAIIVAKLNDFIEYKALAMTGICAGRKDKVKIGDVIFANSLWNYQRGKIDSEGKFQGQPYHYHLDRVWVQRIQHFNKYEIDFNQFDGNKSFVEDFNIYSAPIATGDTVRRDGNIFSELSDSMISVLGVEMEASMIGAFAESKNIPFLVAKGVSDYGDGDKNDDYQSFAAYSSAKCLIQVLINSIDLFDSIGKDPYSYLDNFTHIEIPDSTGYALLMLKVVKFLKKPCFLEEPIGKFRFLNSIKSIATENNIELIGKPNIQGIKALTKNHILRKPFPWEDFWESEPLLCPEGITDLAKLNSVIIVPEKLITDGTSRSRAEKQSLGWEAFDQFKESFNNKTLILGQHFDKNKSEEVELIMKHCKERNVIIPGVDKNPEVFGMRGVPLHVWSEMYKNADFLVGIAGTHTWQLLTMFPNKPQIILSSRITEDDYEDFDEITKSLENVVSISFSPNPEGNQIDIIATKVKDAVKKINLLCSRN